MKQILGITLLAFSILLAGCGGGSGGSTPPPANVKVVPGDTSASVSWTTDPNTEYWVWVAQGNDATTSNCATTSACKILVNVSSPFIITGLTDGTLYSVTVNSRTNNGPGGPGSPPIAFVPRIAGATWTAGAPLTTANLLGLAFTVTTTAGVNTVIAVGAGGAIFYSPDAVHWVPETSNVSSNLNAATFAHSLFFAVGDAGTMLTSPDGVTWTAQVPQTKANLYAVTNDGSGTIVAVGAGGTILVSTDGTTWAPADSHTSMDLYGIFNANGRYVAVGANGTILTGTTAGQWTTINPTTSVNLRGVSNGASVATATAAAASTWVVVGDGGALVTSPDGINWIEQLPITANNLTSVVHGTQFVAVGNAGAIFTSVDGLAWQPQVSETTQNLRAVTFTVLTAGSIGVGYVAVGDAGTNLSAF
jgi:hypothetical protein